MDLKLTGKRALICGGSSGLGRAVATALVAEGAHVALLSRDAEKLQAVADALNATGPGMAVVAAAIPAATARTVRGRAFIAVLRVSWVRVIPRADSTPPFRHSGP